MSNSCLGNGTSPFCTCQDYYGYILPEYKIFDRTFQEYTCCFNANNFIIPSDTTGDKWVRTYATRAIDASCNRLLLSKITTDSEFKDQLPILYYQTYLTASLFSKFSAKASINDNVVECAAGSIPYAVSYPNYHDDNINYKFLCYSSDINSLRDIKFLGTDNEIDYKISYIKTVDGGNCTSNVCNVKYTPKNTQYNIGDQVYISKETIASSGSVYSLWFWLFGLFFVIATSAIFYIMYRRGMDKYFSDGVDYLNGVDAGLGHMAAEHSIKLKNSINHINS